MRSRPAPDGNLWFTESAANKIGRITTAGVITEFPIPSASSGPGGIAAGPDGNLWFTELNANQIGRITTAGVITEFPIPTAGSFAIDIAAGPDGNLWFTESNANKIGRITTAGVITEFPIPSASSGPGGIAAGPDGNLWFTEFAARQIGRITTAGVITEFSINGPGCYDIGNSGGCNPKPHRIAAAPDGNLWFTIANTNRIGWIRTTIGRITTAGIVNQFAIPTEKSLPGDIAAGPDGNLWFVENGANGVGRITTGPCVANDTTLCLSAGRFMVTADFETQDGQTGAAHAVTLTASTGYFWFFDPSNVEVVTKILPFCADPFNSIWIFAAGLTNVKVELTYTDTNNGTVVTKKNELGVPFAPVQDTSAFKTCP